MIDIARKLPACLLLVAVLSSPAGGGDWPQWGGTASRNMVSPEVGLVGADFAGLSTRHVRWSAALGSFTFGNVTIAGGRVFVGTNDAVWRDPRARRTDGGVLICLDQRTGKVLWRLLSPRYSKPVHGSGFDDLEAGICSAATIEGDRAYVVSNRGEVLCLDVAGQSDGNDGPFTREGAYMAGAGRKPMALRPGDADIVWAYDMISQLPSAPHDATNCNILIHGDVLYVGTSNGVHRRPDKPNPLPNAPSLIAIHKKTGRLLARDAEGIGKTVFHGQWSSPTLCKVAGRELILFAGGDGVLYAFEPVNPQAHAPNGAPATLKKVWSYDCNPDEYRLDEAGKAKDYWDGDVTRVEIDDSYVGPNEMIATPVVHDGKVYIAVGRDPQHGLARGILHCIDPTGRGDISKTGRVWAYKDIARSMSTVAVRNSLLYVADIVGDIHCLDAVKGTRMWLCRTGEQIWSSPMVADGKVYVGTEEGNLWILAEGKTMKVISKVAFPHAISTTPVAAGGVLYLATHRKLYALSPNAPVAAPNGDVK